MRRLAILLACTVALGAAVGATFSAFSDEATNAGNSFGAAASFCSSPGTQTVSANADTYIRQDQASSNFGTDTALNVRSRNASNQRTLVRFALPSTPSGCTVTSATLRLDASAAASGRTLEAQRVTSSWTESGAGGVTWATPPTTTTMNSATQTSGTGWRQWTVTAQVQSMYAGTNNGFLVRDQAENAGGAGQQQTFRSRESATNPPELVVTFG